MTTTSVAGRASARHALPARGNSLTGTGTLVRFLLRRDRIKLPAWVLGISLFAFYYAAALPQLYKTQEDLQVSASSAEARSVR